MSTILKALKTLETESGTDSEMTLARVAARGPAVRLASNRRRYAWMGALVLLVAGIGLGIHFWPDGVPDARRTANKAANSADGAGSSSKSSEPPSDRPLAADPSKPGPEAGSHTEPGATPVRRQTQSPQQKNPQEGQQTARSGEQTASARPFSAGQKTFEPGRKVVGWSKTRSADKLNENNEAGMKAESRSTQARSTQTPSGERVRETQAADPSAGKEKPPGNKPRAGKQASLPVFKDSGLEIQALSWDANPESRIAVINSRLCREGDRIGSYRIVAINPDDVVVARGSHRGRLVITRH